MKTLVAFFSKSGVTGECAKKIAEILGADTFEIKTEKQYPPGFIKTIKVCRKEMNSGERPALVENVPNFDEYDRVFIGFPVWFGTCPMAVVSFLEQYDWSGKDIYPFCTSTSTDIKTGESDIAKYTGQRVHQGLRMKNIKSLDEEEIRRWAL